MSSSLVEWPIQGRSGSW